MYFCVETFGKPIISIIASDPILLCKGSTGLQWDYINRFQLFNLHSSCYAVP